ncbi:hypothetical protein [Ottowia sp.]|uniref:hypothetical protein n=1 Tax=Ottowia sp. TaxID=1898956 RepID=UPI0025DA3859|nr:hypothetical protein [Ottowia sp.]MBK6616417.1 hypothetical protein [Ottowia sp.]
MKKSISLPPTVCAFLRTLGGGVVSRGVERAVAAYRRMSIEERAAPRPVGPAGPEAVETSKMSISVSSETYVFLLQVGGGTLSNGVKIAAEAAMSVDSAAQPIATSGDRVPAPIAVTRRARGRPRFDEGGRRVKKSISLYPRVGAFLRTLGEGVVSHGVEHAAATYRSLSPQQVAVALAHKPEGLVAVEVDKMSISVSAETYELLLVVGDGTFSHGVKTVAEVAMGLQEMRA